MKKMYIEPEYKVVEMTNEDVLTESSLNLFNNPWETHNSAPLE